MVPLCVIVSSEVAVGNKYMLAEDCAPSVSITLPLNASAKPLADFEFLACAVAVVNEDDKNRSAGCSIKDLTFEARDVVSCNKCISRKTWSEGV